MKLNCRPGDLALIVRSVAGNEGKIVRCIKFIGAVPGFAGNDRWEIDTFLPANWGRTANSFHDAWLRPLRDEEGDDEMIQIAGKPKYNLTTTA